MKQVYLLTGGNLGDRIQNLVKAGKLIDSLCGPIIRKSNLYETAAWGNIPQPDFLNQVLLIETKLSPTNLLEHILDIEHKMGRFRDARYGPRLIDIDILFYDDEIIHEDHLQIPHPRIAERRFVLVPLNEIASGFRHPVHDKTIGELLDECADELPVYKFNSIVNNKD